MSHRRVYNLERDIKSTWWIIDRIRRDEIYAQNLYAAFCNHEFVPEDVWGILTNVRWSCPWHYAATMVAEIREEYDPSKWYCSGVQLINPRFVPESVIVPEIEKDIKNIGWLVQPISNN